MGYIDVIKTSIFVFPFVCVVLSLPFLIYHYRKYGSISFLRFLLIFSFFFYLLCMYFLVILPLPSKESVLSSTREFYNLKPFFVVPEIVMSGEFNLTNMDTYVFLLNQKYIEPLFNILMVIPFGIYLRYYFKCGFFKTLFYSFLLSLFFELTQLSGLYFIYPRPYRLCDVNDLINNTCGGVIVYLISPLFSFFLPSRDKIDTSSYESGKSVSVLRHGVALIIDYFIVFFIYFGITFLFHIQYSSLLYFLIIFVYFVIFSCFSSGYTFGKWILRFRSIGEGVDNHIPFYKYFFKCFVLHFLILNSWFYIFFLCSLFNTDYLFGFLVYFIIMFLFLLYSFFCLILNRDIFINKFLKIDSISVIGIGYDDEI